MKNSRDIEGGWDMSEYKEIREKYEQWLKDNFLAEFPNKPDIVSYPWNAFRDATLAERERCAKVVESMLATYHNVLISEAIRRGE